MLCNKNSENPRKGFYNRGIGGWTKSKNEYFFELSITQAFFCPFSWNFTTTRSGDSCFLGHPNVHKAHINHLHLLCREIIEFFTLQRVTEINLLAKLVEGTQREVKIVISRKSCCLEYQLQRRDGKKIRNFLALKKDCWRIFKNSQ